MQMCKCEFGVPYLLGSLVTRFLLGSFINLGYPDIPPEQRKLSQMDAYP